MTEEQILKGQQLIKELDKNKRYLEYWQLATDYYRDMSFNYLTEKCLGTCICPNVIPFEEYKARAIYYFQNKVNKLQTEFDNL